VNEAFKEFLALSKQDRQDVFEAKAEELDTSQNVKRDFNIIE
jgi:hypothetical protein